MLGGAHGFAARCDARGAGAGRLATRAAARRAEELRAPREALITVLSERRIGSAEQRAARRAEVEASLPALASAGARRAARHLSLIHISEPTRPY